MRGRVSERMFGRRKRTEPGSKIPQFRVPGLKKVGIKAAWVIIKYLHPSVTVPF